MTSSRIRRMYVCQIAEKLKLSKSFMYTVLGRPEFESMKANQGEYPVRFFITDEFKQALKTVLEAKRRRNPARFLFLKAIDTL